MDTPNEETSTNDSADKLVPSNNPQEVQSNVNDSVDVSKKYVFCSIFFLYKYKVLV